MNSRVKKRLEQLKAFVNKIQPELDCIEMDIEEVEEPSDLFTIESAFERITRIALDAKAVVRDTEDEFDDN